MTQCSTYKACSHSCNDMEKGADEPILFFFRGYAGVCKVASQKSLSKSKRCWDTRAHTKPTWECVGYCRLRKYSIKVRYSQSEKSNEKTAKRAVAIFYNGNNSGQSPAKISEKKSPAERRQSQRRPRSKQRTKSTARPINTALNTNQQRQHGRSKANAITRVNGQRVAWPRPRPLRRVEQ